MAQEIENVLRGTVAVVAGATRGAGRAIAVTPGFLRSEAMLDHFGVTEDTWRDGAEKDPHFIASETPYYVGRAIRVLALDARVADKAGRTLSSWDLSREYGFTDIDGRQPHWGEYFAEHIAGK